MQFTIKAATGASGWLRVSILDASSNILSSDVRSYSSTTTVTVSANTAEGINYLLMEPLNTANSLTGDYVVTPASGSDIRETEPNDSTGAATAITLNGIDFKGNLSSGTDKDYFRFTSPGGVVQFTILDASSNILSSDERSYSSTTTVTVSANTAAGTNYLLIEPYNSSNSMNGDYVIIITKIPVTGVCGIDNGKTLVSSAPLNLCDKGTASNISGNGHPWSWTCQGDIGTNPTQCNASIQTFSLTVTVPAVSGNGDVQADVLSNDEVPVSIFCPKSFCSAQFDFGKTVKLTANPDQISLFTSWIGDCTAAPCNIEMTGSKAVTANFTRDYNFKNVRSGQIDNSLNNLMLSAYSKDEIRILATELEIDSLVLIKALTLDGGWKALHTLQAENPTTLNCNITIQEDLVIKNTTVKGLISIQSGSLRADGLKIQP